MVINKSEYIRMKSSRLMFIIFSIILWMSIEITARIYDWYRIYPSYDLLSHILFGVAWTGLWWIIILPKNNLKKGVFIKEATITYLIIAGIWEVIEMIGDTLLFNTDYLQDTFFWDGAIDMLVGLIGVYIAYYIIKYKLK